MCGVVGFLGGDYNKNESVVVSMANRLIHRGPDSNGYWFDTSAGVSLAHLRLSIVDLSPAGHQPIHSPCGRYTLVFNGEIYNHVELRKILETEGGAFQWRSHSDTEVLLAGLRHWGIDGCLKKLNGMFAFALWDATEQTLFLARDRMGEKPLYYGRAGKSFLFGSELKALQVHPEWRGEVDRDALALYMRHNYVPTPWSIYKGIKKLKPAHYLIVRNNGNCISEPIPYWDLPHIASTGVSLPKGNIIELTNELDQLLRESVGLRMMADVPLGAFLSGGIDSTMVVAQMQAQSIQPVKTFSIGFQEAGYNEAHHAKAVATHLGTDHTELYVTSEEAMAVIPRLASIYDEPFADSSQIPTFLVSQLAGQHVKVSLSGDGGDELFCGYNRYTMGYSVWSKLQLLPNSLRQLLASAIAHAPYQTLQSLQQLLPKSLQLGYLPDRLPKLAEVLKHKDAALFYRDLVSHWKHPDKIVLDSNDPVTLISDMTALPKFDDFRNSMMLLDMLSYLPDDILTKVDRASMAVSLEARVPLLDHRLVEFAWKIPLEYKIKDGQSKWILRSVLDRYVPRNIMERPKMGFGVPIEHWLREPLRDWAEALLDEKRLTDEGYFDPVQIRTMWSEHLSGRRRWHYRLWDVLMFQSWLDTNSV